MSLIVPSYYVHCAPPVDVLRETIQADGQTDRHGEAILHMFATFTCKSDLKLRPTMKLRVGRIEKTGET
jgi:hypothetical protein